jgi:hypothetical protein
MKGEHDWDHRNLERHRRDALTMERLTSSPYIISIYGHCGNTVSISNAFSVFGMFELDIHLIRHLYAKRF